MLLTKKGIPMKKQINFTKCQDFAKILEEAYYNFSSKYKKELFDNYSVDSPRDYAKFIIAHVDILCDVDINSCV